MAPKASVEETVIQTKGLEGSDQSTVGRTMAMTMSNTAHGGRAGFFLVRLGAVFADVLADLEFAQLLDDVRADEQRDEQRGERREGGAEREIAKDAEGVKERKELFVEQPVKQVASEGGVRRVSA